MITQKQKPMTTPIRILIGVILLGALFKILHWSFANLVLVGAFGAIAVLYTIRFNLKPIKRLDDYFKLGIVVFWSVQAILALLYLPFRMPFIIGLVICLVGLLFTNNGEYLRKLPLPFEYGEAATKPRGRSNSLLRIAALVIVLGALFKILHLPGGDIMLIAGLGLAVLSFILGNK